MLLCTEGPVASHHDRRMIWRTRSLVGSAMIQKYDVTEAAVIESLSDQ